MATLAPPSPGFHRAAIRATIATAIVALCMWQPASAADGIRLQVQAGVGGMTRPSRWTPVRVIVSNTGSDIAGELLIEWGDARLHRAVTLAAPSRIEVESYLRTSDVRGSVNVQLVASGAVVASDHAPVQIADDADSVNVCVASAGVAGSGTECTTTVAPGDLPWSMRGYDAVDAVSWRGGSESVLSATQRNAIQRWRAYHALEEDGLLARAPQVPWDPSAAGALLPAASTMASVAIYLALLLGACAVWFRRPRPAVRAYGGFVLAIALATAGAAWSGRVGPGSAIVVQHATTLQQVGTGSVVALRATIEYPAFDRYVLQSTVADGALAERFAAAPEQWLDDDGMPVRSGTFGRGTREEVEFEGVTDYAPLRVSADGDVVHVANVSDQPLSGCRFPDGYSRTGVTALGPGTSVDAREIGHPEAPFFVCRVSQPPVTFTDARFPVQTSGLVLLSVRLPDVYGEGDAR